MQLSRDLREFIALLTANGVEFLVDWLRRPEALRQLFAGLG